ncbi:hypothetical protein [Pararobbsia alpina]|uniref:hypothetical protein n=1 Tax=Pararobbsia alpina TaxID=621374 RepID=UPI0039A550A0
MTTRHELTEVEQEIRKSETVLAAMVDYVALMRKLGLRMAGGRLKIAVLKCDIAELNYRRARLAFEVKRRR